MPSCRSDRRSEEKLMAPSEQMAFQAAAIRGLLQNTSLDQLDNATPCAKWAVRDLLNHLVGGGRMIGGALKGDPAPVDPDGPMPDLLGEDLVGAWDGAIGTFAEGIDTPGALEREVVLPFGTLTGGMLLEILKFDLLVHAWDLATATGQQFDPPAEVVEPTLGTAQMIITPESRSGEPFGPEVTAPVGASPIERLSAFTGRSV
jgi:uncharacterized protein (TIGR03086 family)